MVDAGQHNVIVCVLDATTDWASAAAISYAKRHDPSGERTLFVVTKIDRREAGLRPALDSLQRDHLQSQTPRDYVLVRLQCTDRPCSSPWQVLPAVSAMCSYVTHRLQVSETPGVANVRRHKCRLCSCMGHELATPGDVMLSQRKLDIPFQSKVDT